MFVAAGACNEASHSRRDAAVETTDDASDAPGVDAAIDGPPDASIDGPPDAYVAYPPECTSGAATLIDLSPREIGDTALSGTVLYISAYEQADTGDVSNSVILSIDLTTGNEAFAPITTAGDASLVTVGSDVYASISTGGTIMRLHPGDTPATLITGRPSAGAVTADSTYLYWSERATPGDPDALKRRLLSGGTVENLITCNQATQLFVIGNNLYCVPFTGSVVSVAKDGSGQVTAYTTNGYPLVSTIHDGSELYFAGFSVYPQLHHMPVPAGPISLLHESATFGRFTGLAATSTHFYVTHMDQGIRRFRRSDLATSVISADYVVTGDPVIWNNRLYYATASFTDADQHRLRYCVD